MLHFDEKYLYNFTEWEKVLFRRQSHREQVDFEGWEQKFFELLYSDSSAIFGNDDPKPFSKLDVKYTINRLALNDPKLTHLPFGCGDKVAGNSDAIKIAKAIKGNTYCQTYEFRHCGFSDRGAILILKALKDKEVSITLADAYLSDTTFKYALQVMNDAHNQWKQLDFGPIAPSAEVKAQLDKNPKIKYSVKTPGLIQRFLMNHCAQRG